MIKLFKYEWKRYGFSIIMLFVATAAIAVIMAICMAGFATNYRSDSSWEFMGQASIVMLSVVLCLMPYSGYVYSLISYITDISKRGMLSLTPSSTWATTAVKLLLGAGVYIALFLETSLFAFLLNIFAQTLPEAEKWLSDSSLSGLFIESWSKFALTGTTNLVNILLGCARITASIALARFAVSSIGGQVVLTIVFNYLAGIITTMINVLIAYIIIPDEAGIALLFSSLAGLFEKDFSVYMILGIILNLLYAGVMYVITAVLTEKKVNLA